MLAGAVEQKSEFLVLDPQNPQSLERLDSLDPNRDLSLEIHIKGNLTTAIVERLNVTLPKLKVTAFNLQVSSSNIQKNEHLIVIINLIYFSNFTQVDLYINLDAQQLQLMLHAVHLNTQITSFSLKRTFMTGDLLSVFLTQLEEFKRTKRKFEAFSVMIAKLDTIHLVAILKALGPFNLKALNFSLNNTAEKGEGFDLLSQALLEPQCSLNVLHLTGPFGGEAENQAIPFCDTLAKIPRNFDLHLTFGLRFSPYIPDFVLLKQALYLNPRLCVYIKGSPTQLEPFQNEIEAIAVLTEQNRFIRESNDPNLLRQRYDSLALSGYQCLWEYPISKEVKRTVPSLQSLAAKAVKANKALSVHLASIPELCLQSLPETSMDNYEQVLRGLYNLKIVEKSEDDPEKAQQDKFNNMVRSLRLFSS